MEQVKLELRDGKSLTRANGSAVIWAIASTLFAQKHLAFISDKLDSIVDRRLMGSS